MPTVTAFLDDLRAAFGAECINRSIKAGMAGQPVFYAEEGGQSLGCSATLVVNDAAVFDRSALEALVNDVAARRDAERVSVDRKGRAR